MYDLQGKVALVTGCAGSRGIGHAIAVRLATDGADIIANDREAVPAREQHYGDWQGLNSVVKEVEGLGRRAIAIAADVTKSREVGDMVAKALAHFGHIDILVNNAGGVVGLGALAIDYDDLAWSATLTLNATGAFLCSKAVCKSMVEKGIRGKVVNIASINGKQIYRAGNAAYVTAKAGVIGLTKALAIDLAPYKINVNAVCPGPIDTDLLGGTLARIAREQGITLDEAREQYVRCAPVPLGRLGQPAEIASLVAFLASSEAEFITGQAINIDGGCSHGPLFGATARPKGTTQS